MIGRETGQGKSIITICNYAKYQDFSEKTGQVTEQLSGPQKNKETKKQDSSVADATGAEAPVVPVQAADVVKVIFDTGVAILAADGMPQPKSRSLIGRWRKDYSDGVVLTVLSRCGAEQPSAPVEWITRALQSEERKAAAQRHPQRGNNRRPLQRENFADKDYGEGGLF